jgi:hypothetical protein
MGVVKDLGMTRLPPFGPEPPQMAGMRVVETLKGFGGGSTTSIWDKGVGHPQMAGMGAASHPQRVWGWLDHTHLGQGGGRATQNDRNATPNFFFPFFFFLIFN